MKRKIAIGVSAATQTCGTYWPKKRLQLLDPVDHRQHDAAGALAGEPGRAELGDLVVETPAQVVLHHRGGAVRDDGADVIEQRPRDDRRRDPGSRERDRPGPGAGEDQRQQGAEQRETGDPEPGRGQADNDAGGDPAAQPAGQLPQAPVEIHQRTFSSELAVRCASLSVRGSATSTVRCSVGRGVAVTMLTPLGAEKRCQVFCGTTTVVPAATSWLSGPLAAILVDETTPGLSGKGRTSAGSSNRSGTLLRRACPTPTGL